MKYRLLKWLACPKCGNEDLTLEVRSASREAIAPGSFSEEEGDWPGIDLEEGIETVVDEGALHCSACAAIYPIREGVPRMNVAERTEELGSPHRWTTFDAGAPEWQENFLDYASPLLPNDFIGQLVLDAGCGYGRHAFFAGRYGAEVVAFDRSSDAIAAAVANTVGLQRVHLVQGDIEHPPFREEMFDLTYCFGVLHHLQDPGEAFRILGRSLRSGGRLSLWVYGPRKGAALHVANALRGLTSGLGPQQLHNLSRVIAGGLRAFSHTPYRMMGALPVAKAVVSRLPVHDHHQWPYDVVVADIYDRLRIPVTKWFPRELLDKMYTDDGYVDVQVSRRVGNNESFRATGVRR